MAQQNTTPEVGTEYEGPRAPHRLDWNDTFTVEVEDISEAREAAKHAEALGFELSHACLRGNWEAQNRSGEYPHSVHYGSDNVKPILNLGRTWFLSVVDGDVERVRPAEGSSVRDAGHAILEFVKEGEN